MPANLSVILHVLRAFFVCVCVYITGYIITPALTKKRA